MRTPRATALFLLIAALAAACQSGKAHDAPTSAGAAPVAAAPAPAPAPLANDPWSKPEAKAELLAKPLFFAIEKAGKTTYALGTFHTGVDATTQLPPSVWKKLDAATTFAMETDISDASLAQALATRHDGKTLHAELGDAYWKKLEDVLTPKVARRLDTMTATVAATLLSLHGLPSTPPMDGVLFGHAQNQHKHVVYLEAASVQVAALVKWMDTRALEEMLDDMEYGEKMKKEMLAAYVAGDDAAILKLSVGEKDEFKKHGRSDAEYDEMMSDMLYRRNASWIEPIEKMHAEGGAFIAVGAMHLIGPRSVLDLLAAKGYKVTRLTP